MVQIGDPRPDSRLATGFDIGSDVGVVVLNSDGTVASANDQARRQLEVDATRLRSRVRELIRAIAGQAASVVTLEGLAPLQVRVVDTGAVGVPFRVLLLESLASSDEACRVWEQASIHRGWSSLQRDWAHDFKGLLHVIRMNQVLAARLVDAVKPVDAARRRKCLDAIARGIVQLEAAIDVVFRARRDSQWAVFDLADTCRQLLPVLEARASRQRVTIEFERSGAATDVVGAEDRMACALFAMCINALDAMRDGGRLLVSIRGERSGVVVRVCDSGVGMPPELSTRLPSGDFDQATRQSGIGLKVTRRIVKAHSGRIGSTPNAPHGTCIEVILPPAAVKGSGTAYGSRAYR